MINTTAIIRLHTQYREATNGVALVNFETEAMRLGFDVHYTGHVPVLYQDGVKVATFNGHTLKMEAIGTVYEALEYTRLWEALNDVETVLDRFTTTVERTIYKANQGKRAVMALAKHPNLLNESPKKLLQFLAIADRIYSALPVIDYLNKEANT